MKTNLRVCTIGGGSGMPIINKGLIRAGFKNIKSIVTTFDNGGDTGRMRTDERGNILAFSDYWRSLISLWDDGKQKTIWKDMLRYRDGRGRNFGNIFFQFMSEKTGNLSNVDLLFSSLVKAKLKGEVIPVSLSPAHICFSTISGKKYFDEHYLDDLRMSLDKVKKMWIKPLVRANEEAIKAVLDSDVIIICPGSLYGSVLINFLPMGMKQAFNKSKAKKILITNIVSAANENSDATQEEYLNLFKKYLDNKDPFDLIIMPDFTALKKNLLKKVLGLYKFEHSFPILKTEDNDKKTIIADIAMIERKNLRLRHSEKKLINLFKKIEI